jgi:excisionase family DNA binding protein
MAPKLYTTSEAASAIGVSRQTLQTWIADGKVKPPKMIGSTRVWTESEVKELRQLPRKGRKPKRKR